MQINGNYKYDSSLSQIAFQNKEISGAMIGSTTNKENREIRKRYGFKASEGVSYERVNNLTPETHLKALLSGRVMCNLFNPTKYKKGSNLFSSCEKKNENFAGSYTIGIDVDETRYASISEYLNKLSLKPTFYYSSYSHLQKKEDGTSKGVRFRMIYVLDENSFIPENYLLFRYCAMCLTRIIEKETGEEVDHCSRQAAQFFNGTNINNPDLNVEYGLTNFIYNFADFGVSPDGFVNFLENGCEYASLDKDQRAKIITTLDKFTGNDYEWSKTEKKFVVKPVVITCTDPSINASYPVDPTTLPFDATSEQILKDWDRYKESEFKKFRDWENRRNSTKYIYRVEGDWYKDKWQKVDENYFMLFYYRDKLKDGQKRRKTLYQRICLRRVIDPSITRDQMLVNTLIDVMRFFDNSDFCLNSDTIRELIENAFNLTVDDIKTEMKDQIEWLKANTRPKKGIIYKEASDYTQETIFEILDDLYDRTKSVAENLMILNDTYGFLISQSHLYRYLENRNVKTVKDGISSDDEIKALIDPSLSSRKNLEVIKAKGIKLSLKRIQKLLKDIKA